MVLRRWISLLAILTWSLTSSAMCLLDEALSNPALRDNNAFWEDYAKLTQKGKTSDSDLQGLMERYHASPKKVESSGSAKPMLQTNNYNIQGKAEKEIRGLPKSIRQDVDEFLNIVASPGGIQELYKNPGRWHFEKVPKYGPEARTVRLNDGYRVLFDMRDNHVEIRRVNKESH